MKLGFNTEFAGLYSRDGLMALDAAFVNALKENDHVLYNRLLEARSTKLQPKNESQLIIDLAPLLEDFIAELFGIRQEVATLKAKHFILAPLYSCKRLFVQRKAVKTINAEKAALLEGEALSASFPAPDDSIHSFELAFATSVMGWLDDEASHKAELETAMQYAAWAVHTSAGQEKHKGGVLFKIPKKMDPLHLVHYETEVKDGITVIKANAHHIRQRNGFALTDDGVTLSKALDEANYCIWCHNQGKDSCSKGMKEAGVNLASEDTRKSETTTPRSEGVGVSEGGASPLLQKPTYKTNSLGIPLAGCPLEEKISEMHFLKSEGIPLGALATIVIDNPMCAGTGHRICNDCMKSCIYQKQEAVNIPQAETRTLMDILELPYGFEIYSLLTRWNPLNFARTLPKAESGYKVLVAGLGPSGYTLAHHLMNDGHTVVGIDGLKIEPLPEVVSGVNQSGARVPFAPVNDINALFESLDERVLAGFGGVAEYGITVRWDKNFLKVIRLLLERRQQFSMIGGVRFGSTVTIDQAWKLGFDHIALCMGAGKPTVLNIPGGLARGVRTASDFLMSLQLTGAAKKDSIANLQLRLPIVVIGGGLTAIDTATESLAYYPIQVEKFLARYEILVAEQGEAAITKNWSEEDSEIAQEFIAHANAIREERKKPNPDIYGLLEKWGGVKLIYRKRLIDAPSYRLNHEEVEKALEEGIFIGEELEPLAVEVDRFGHIGSLEVQKSGSRETMKLPARALLVAAGTSPNTVLQREFPEEIKLHGKYFQAIDEDGNTISPEKTCKPAIANVLMSMDKEGRAVSFFGDLHPSFAGNVVKAMGSAKQGYPVISRILAKRNSPSYVTQDAFLNKINTQLRATVHSVIRLTSNIIEVIIKAPMAAGNFEPGQFYRLQNFEANAKTMISEYFCKDTWKSEAMTPRSERVSVSEGEASPLKQKSLATTLAMEGLALTGAWVDKEQGLLSTIVLEMGGSSNLCAHLKPGEPVILMGPTGTRTEIHENSTVMLIGGGLGNAVLFSIGKAARAKGSKVLYFAGYKKATDRYKIEEIEKASDVIIWACDEASDFTPDRPQDKVFQGNIVQAILAYAEGGLGETTLKTQEVEHIIAIGSDRMMAAIAAARHNVLKPHLRENHTAIGSINSPMQCMMKEICAQCLQQHIDAETGEITYVYSCFNQDQALDNVVFPFLNERLKQNSVQEKLTMCWIDKLLTWQDTL